MIQLIRPLRSGQITIPVTLRSKLGIDDQTILQVRVTGQELRIKPVKIVSPAKSSPWLKDLYDHFSEVRREAKRYSEQEINSVIDQAVKATRKSPKARG